MPHETVLIATIAAGIGLAFILGFIGARLGLPPLVGYLLAGIAVGPYSPGFVADAALAGQLAEIGVILLMFGVGLHFSLRDLMAVRKIALPGAVVQIGVASLLGMGVSRLWGWSWSAGFVFGLCLSVASTVVLLKALEDNGVLDSINGRIAVGWLIVEDLAMVLALVLLPAFAAPAIGDVVAGAQVEQKSLLVTLATTLAGVVAFIVVMLVVGRKYVPWLLARVAKLGSRELFTLAVLAIALGIAVGSAALFGVSFALGAFFAGVIISESDLSHRAAADALPLQDAFAVLFFVSVGMLVDPMVIIEQPLNVLAVLAIIMIGKSAAAFGIVLLFKYPLRTALTVSASLAQIGEFSFILAGMAVAYNILPAEGQSLILVGALLSIALNQLCFAAIEPINSWFKSKPGLARFVEKSSTGDEDILPPEYETISNHAIIVGHGRVGSWIAKALERSNIPYMVIEEDRLVVEALRRDSGILAIFGDASRPGILSHAHLSTAKLLIIATPTSYQARHILEIAKKENPDIDTVVRTHSAKEQHFLRENGANRVVMGEFELAFSMAEYALQSYGRGPETIISTIDELRSETLADDEAENITVVAA